MSINETESSNQSEENNAETSQTNLKQDKSEAISSTKNAATNLLSSALALKESNPKVFFGGIGAVVLLLVVIIISGGGSGAKLTQYSSKPIVIGQNYVLKSANAYDQQSNIRLVGVPGSMAAYDETEEADREGCKHVKQGTPVKVIQSQDAYGKKDVFVEVEMTSGECEGKRGWVLAINLQ